MSNLLTPARANTSPSTKSGMMDLAALLQLQQQRQQLEQLQLRQEQQQSRDALMRVLLQQQVASVSTNTVNRVSPSASVATSASTLATPASTSAPTMSASLDRERREQKMYVADALFRTKNSSSAKAAAAAAASKNKKNAQEEEPPKTSQEDPRQSQLSQEILLQEGTAAVAKREAQLQMLRALAFPATSRIPQEQRMLALLTARATPGSMMPQRLSLNTASFSSLSEASSQPSASDTAVSSTVSEILRLQLRARLQSASRTVTATPRSTSSSGAVNRLLEQKQILELLARNQEPMRLQPASAAPKPEEDAHAMDTTSALSSKKARGRTSRFPKILHQVLLEMDVSQGSTSGRPIAGFSKDGKSFAIHNLKEFFVQVGATHFKMSSFASFQRQLNLYNFQKLHTGSAGGAYKHPLFQRDQPELLETLRRTKIKSSPTGK